MKIILIGHSFPISKNSVVLTTNVKKVKGFNNSCPFKNYIDMLMMSYFIARKTQQFQILRWSGFSNKYKKIEYSNHIVNLLTIGFESKI